MSLNEHFAALAVYEAGTIRLEPTEGASQEKAFDGGGLQRSFERLGRRPLLAALRDPDVGGVVLSDGELSIALKRSGANAALKVAYNDQVIVDDAVAVPPPATLEPGPWFRPDPESRVDRAALHASSDPLFVVEESDGRHAWFTAGLHGKGAGQRKLVASVPTMGPESLGSDAFRSAHGVKWCIVAGAMAGGISSADLVLAMAKEGLLGFFGAGGLPLAAVEEALQRVSSEAGDGAWGFNLLHNPAEPGVEEETVDLYLKYGVRRVSASAYMGLSRAIVRYRLTGIHADDQGRAVCPNHVFAKVSRPEVAEPFLRPAPADMIAKLVEDGVLSAEQAELAKTVPVAEDVTAEADSGGHTDHRPFLVLLPSLQRLRDRISVEEGYAERGIRPRVGAAGGIGTPEAAHAAFAMGADYILTGSVNQAAREAGTSDLAKSMLADASWWEVASGPAPDMFELGAKVQVLSRGSMYAQRAQRLYDLYKAHDGFEVIPDKERARIEKQMFKRSLDDVWADTRAYWMERDPAQAERADGDARHRMALTFRWYLGMTSRWARTGEDDRKRDFQVWCGPAMGAFNEWAEGESLAPLENRTVAAISEALLRGAAGLARARMADSLGV